MQSLVKSVEGEGPHGKLFYRRLSLCCMLGILTLLVSINIGLTLWLLATLHFDLEGSGPVQYRPGGLSVEGSTQVMGELVTSKLKASKSSLLQLLGDRQVLLSSGATSLTLKPNTEIRSNEFTISDSVGSPLLTVGSDTVTVSKGRLVAGSASLGQALQTSRLRSRVGEDLLIESALGSLELVGPNATNISSSRGNVSLTGHNGVILEAHTGKIMLDSPSVHLPRLSLASNYTQTPNPSLNNVIYQVCVCSSGRLFLADASSSCLARPAVCSET